MARRTSPLHAQVIVMRKVQMGSVVPGVLVACAGVLAGCTHAPPVDMSGQDGTFTFSWRINGQDATSASDPCTAAGIRFIRMAVVDDQNVTHYNAAFNFDCHLGTYSSAQPDLAAGTYNLYWEAVSTTGMRVSLAAGTYVNGTLQPTLEQVTVTPGAHVDFDAMNRPDDTFPPAPTNFATGTGPLNAYFTWAATPGASSGSPYDVAGVHAVSWTLRRSNHVPFDDHPTRALTADGYSALGWSSVDFDTYTVEIHGYDTQGVEHWHSICPVTAVTPPDTTAARLDCLVDRSSP